MSDRRVRAAFIGLILAFPLLMLRMSPRASTVRQAALPLFLVESMLAFGLMSAYRERQRLLTERQRPVVSPRPLLGAPHARVSARRVPVARS
ncbi:MAG: hypothetical protein NVSMB9_26740 [Isosphaeraceae bacterium]